MRHDIVYWIGFHTLSDWEISLATEDRRDEDAGIAPLSPEEILFARLLGGKSTIENAVEKACTENPELAGALQQQLSEYLRRRKDRLARNRDSSNSRSAGDIEGLAERLLNRYSDELELNSDEGDQESVPLSPELEGRYDFLEEIARGGMGAVFKISDPVLQRELAMKVVLGDSSGDAPPQRLRRFLREARVTAQLSHPGIVAVHELNSDADGRFYFTMDRVEGKEFRDIMRDARGGKEAWDRDRLLEVLLRVCDTLEYAHSRGVVHRDVKPSNIMVGQFGEVFLMDWGLARILAEKEDEPIEDILSDTMPNSTPGSTVITRDGAVVGTPSYMSLEQADPEVAEVGPWTDVYAIGAILYEILSGRPPYRSGSTPLPGHKVLQRLKKGPPPDILEIRPDAPDDLVQICRLAMDRDSALRPQSGGEISKKIREVLKVRAQAAEQTRQAREHADRSRSVTRFLTDLFLHESGEIPSLHRVSGHDLLDRGAQELLEGMDEQPQTRAALLGTLASIMLVTGAAERASELLQAETQLRRESPTWPAEERIYSLRNLAKANTALRQLSSAEEALQEALESIPVGDPDSITREVQHELASLLNTRGDWPQAEEILRDLLVNFSPQKNVEKVPFLISLGQSVNYQGFWEEARESLDEAVSICEESDSSLLASALLHRAGLLLEAHREDVSDEMLTSSLVDMEKSVQLQIKRRGERSDHTSRHLRALACYQQRMGNLEEAEQNARTALLSVRQLHVIEHPLCARSFARLASIVLRAGRQDEANKLLAEAGMTMITGNISSELQFPALEAKARILSLAQNWPEATKVIHELDSTGDELPPARLKRRNELERICQDAGFEARYGE